MRLRSNWHQRIAQAIAYLRRLDTPIARRTLEAIDQAKVKLRPFSDMKLRHLSQILKHCDFSFKPDDSRLKKLGHMSDQYYGFSLDDYVYISLKRFPVHKIAELLVHEVNHYLNESCLKWGTASAELILVEELRAELSEHFVYQHSPCITTRFLEQKKRRVISLYSLPLDPKEPLTSTQREACLRGL